MQMEQRKKKNQLTNLLLHFQRGICRLMARPLYCIGDKNSSSCFFFLAIFVSHRQQWEVASNPRLTASLSTKEQDQRGRRLSWG